MDFLKLSFSLLLLLIACCVANPLSQKASPECPPVGDYNYSHEDCRKYYVCTNGYLYVFTCPEFTFWQQETLICDYDNSSCNADPTSTPPTSNSTPQTSYLPTSAAPTTVEAGTEAPSTLSAEDSTTEAPEFSTYPQPSTANQYPCPKTGYHTLPDLSYCHLYYRCYEGDFIGSYSCGAVQWFDSREKKCVDPELSDCPYPQERP